MASWWLFGLAIVFTLVSFVLSQLAIKRQLKYAEKYYLEEEERYLKEKNCPAIWTEYVNYVSGIFFVIAIVTTICFVSTNIKGGSIMANISRKSTNDGAPIPSMQRIRTEIEKRGAPIPGMQPVVPTSSSQQSSSQGSQSGVNAEKTKK